jgi:aspartyl protease
VPLYRRTKVVMRQGGKLMKPGDKIVGFLKTQQFIGESEGRARGPFVLVAIASDPKWHPSSPDDLPPLKTAETVIALVDTGADTCAIDTDLATKLELAVVGQAQGNYTGSLEAVLLVFAQICFPKERHVAGQIIMVRPLKSGGARYEVILGMDFLKSFDIHVSDQDNLVELTYLEKSDK